MRTLLAAVVVGFGAVFLFPGATLAQVASAQPVSLEMNVPADGSVWIDGQATTQQGADRHFVSPPLQSGTRYYYDIRVKWKEGSKTLECSRRVRFQAGDQVRMNLVRADVPALDVTVARPVPSSVGTGPTIVQFDSAPPFTPGLKSEDLSGPGPGGLEHQ